MQILPLFFCQAQPQAPAQTQLWAEISIIIVLSSHPHPPLPTRESIIQTQIILDLKSKVVDYNG